ncbi:MAG: DUF4258 domain-containing protein [Armatimonadota bacterium]
METNSKKIIFTAHLIMRLKVRNIKKEHIYEAFRKNKGIKKGYKKANLITAKVNNSKELTVVYEEKLTTIIVITAYWEVKQ